MKVTMQLPLMCFALAALCACKDKDPKPTTKVQPCTTQVLPVKSLETEYGCTNTKFGLQISLPDEKYTVIRSQADFNSRVTGSCLPQIDFDAYDLIIGRKQLTSGSSSLSYQFEQRCQPSRKHLQVIIHEGMTADAPVVTYHALVPKPTLSDSVQVEYSMQQ